MYFACPDIILPSISDVVIEKTAVKLCIMTMILDAFIELYQCFDDKYREGVDIPLARLSKLSYTKKAG